MFKGTANNLERINQVPLGRTMFRTFALTLASTAGMIAGVAGLWTAWGKLEERRADKVEPLDNVAPIK